MMDDEMMEGTGGMTSAKAAAAVNPQP